MLANSNAGKAQKERPKLVMTTTKSALLNKEITDMKIQKRKQDPFEAQKNQFKLSKFSKVTGVVNTNRKAFGHHSTEKKQAAAQPTTHEAVLA